MNISGGQNVIMLKKQFKQVLEVPSDTADSIIQGKTLDISTKEATSICTRFHFEKFTKMEKRGCKGSFPMVY